MAILTDDADYDTGEASDNVPSLPSDTETYANSMAEDFVLLRSLDNKNKLRKRVQPIPITRKKTATIPRATSS
ncbi:unnamed protein product [Protopolystoma xenopodis]|uniref:Uncharacterized protein n=1 Tax=Protopolystoma xenopodis TaxID=117903 RepID=A0A448WR14_9PLAT|nr:unnamed protein product [Protopolystoma xenopodis]